MQRVEEGLNHGGFSPTYPHAAVPTRALAASQRPRIPGIDAWFRGQESSARRAL